MRDYNKEQERYEVVKRMSYMVIELANKIKQLQRSLSFYNKNIPPLSNKESIELARLYQGFFLKESEVDIDIFEKRYEGIRKYESDPMEWYILTKQFIKNNARFNNI